MRTLVRGFVLNGRKSQSTAGSLTILGRHWPRMVEIAVVRPVGPVEYAVTGGALRPIELD